MIIELWPIERPKPYAKNARKWGANAIEKVASSIREYGFRQPIVVDPELMGHSRAEQTLQYTHTPSDQARGVLEGLAAKLVKAAHLDGSKPQKVVHMKRASGQ